jgi:hypothetical protein
MKNIHEVLQQKEADLARVRGEVDALRLVISLLVEKEGRVPGPETKIGPESAPPSDKFVPAPRRQA